MLLIYAIKYHPACAGIFTVTNQRI